MDIAEKRRKQNEYQRRWIAAKRAAAPTALCACGCGTEIPTVRSDNGRLQRFAMGHNGLRGKKLGPQKEIVNQWWARARAREIKGPGPCELEHIGWCSGRIEVHHKNKNVNDNQPENLMRLCKSHHGLVDRGRIDLQDPVMPRFVVRGGWRRYEWSYRIRPDHPDVQGGRPL